MSVPTYVNNNKKALPTKDALKNEKTLINLMGNYR